MYYFSIEIQAYQNRLDSSGMAFVGRRPMCLPVRIAIRTDSETMRHDEATNRSLLIILVIKMDFTRKYPKQKVCQKVEATLLLQPYCLACQCQYESIGKIRRQNSSDK